MELFKRPLQLKERKHPVHLTTTPAVARLDQLPTEILLKIIEYAKPLSATALTLSCKRVQRLVGDYHIRFGIYRTVDLLQLLKRDLLNHIICPYCLKLYKVKVELKIRREVMFGRRREREEVRTFECWCGGVQTVVNVDDLVSFRLFLRHWAIWKKED